MIHQVTLDVSPLYVLSPLSLFISLSLSISFSLSPSLFPSYCVSINVFVFFFIKWRSPLKIYFNKCMKFSLGLKLMIKTIKILINILQNISTFLMKKPVPIIYTYKILYALKIFYNRSKNSAAIQWMSFNPPSLLCNSYNQPFS